MAEESGMTRRRFLKNTTAALSQLTDVAPAIAVGGAVGGLVAAVSTMPSKELRPAAMAMDAVQEKFPNLSAKFIQNIVDADKHGSAFKDEEISHAEEIAALYSTTFKAEASEVGKGFVKDFAKGAGVCAAAAGIVLFTVLLEEQQAISNAEGAKSKRSK